MRFSRVLAIRLDVCSPSFNLLGRFHGVSSARPIVQIQASVTTEDALRQSLGLASVDLPAPGEEEVSDYFLVSSGMRPRTRLTQKPSESFPPSSRAPRQPSYHLA